MCESKPFYCNHAGCEKTFTNEDHLSVHQQKHGLRPLHFNFASSDVNSVVLPFSDQTPTPTKFFRVEEGRLFEEISASGSPANPFDDQFRKATSTTQPVKPIEDALESSRELPNVQSVAEELPQKLIDSVPKPEEKQRASDRPQLPTAYVREASERTRSENASNQDATETSESSTASDKHLFKRVCLRGPLGQLIPVESVETTAGDGRENGRRNFSVKIKLAQKIGNTEWEERELEEEEEEKREQEEAQIKRKIILTRNREAQWRSRKRKKNQVENLEKDCEDLRSTNETLQMELEATRGELAVVKELLQEHVTAGCYVVRKQELEGRLTRDLAAPDLTSGRQLVYKRNQNLNSASNIQFVVANDPSSGSAAEQNSATDQTLTPLSVQNLNPLAGPNQDLVTIDQPILDQHFVPVCVQDIVSAEHQSTVVVCNEDLVDSPHSYTIFYLPDGEAFAL